MTTKALMMGIAGVVMTATLTAFAVLLTAAGIHAGGLGYVLALVPGMLAIALGCLTVCNIGMLFE